MKTIHRLRLLIFVCMLIGGELPLSAQNAGFIVLGDMHYDRAEPEPKRNNLCNNLFLSE
jgi:hypothetical protein